MRGFYEVISFEEGAPDWQRMRDLFSEHARITRITPEAIDYMDHSAFRSRPRLIEVGAFTGFYEHEVARRTDRFGGVMHVAALAKRRFPRMRPIISSAE
jgi:hypothetical protein